MPQDEPDEIDLAVRRLMEEMEPVMAKLRVEEPDMVALPVVQERSAMDTLISTFADFKASFVPPSFDLEEASKRLKESSRRHRSKKLTGDNRLIRSQAVEIGELAKGVEYWVVPNPMRKEWEKIQELHAKGLIKAPLELFSTTMAMSTALNGYVAFNKRHVPLKTHSYWQEDYTERSIFDIIPCHGGITYGLKDEFAAVIGFDTCHYMSDRAPRTDPSWIAGECFRLYRGILAAAKIEKAWLRESNEKRRDLLEAEAFQELDSL